MIDTLLLIICCLHNTRGVLKHVIINLFIHLYISYCYRHCCHGNHRIPVFKYLTFTRLNIRPCFNLRYIYIAMPSFEFVLFILFFFTSFCHPIVILFYYFNSYLIVFCSFHFVILFLLFRFIFHNFDIYYIKICNTKHILRDLYFDL